MVFAFALVGESHSRRYILRKLLLVLVATAFYRLFNGLLLGHDTGNSVSLSLTNRTA
jgi:hypothetical protein